jgi:putative copper export protein
VGVKVTENGICQDGRFTPPSMGWVLLHTSSGDVWFKNIDAMVAFIAVKINGEHNVTVDT